MAERPQKPPATKRSPEREERLKSALKANITRRKQQARARGESGKAEG
jgi:hypothetical protein